MQLHKTKSSKVFIMQKAYFDVMPKCIFNTVCTTASVNNETHFELFNLPLLKTVLSCHQVGISEMNPLCLPAKLN